MCQDDELIGCSLKHIIKINFAGRLIFVAKYENLLINESAL